MIHGCSHPRRAIHCALNASIAASRVSAVPLSAVRLQPHATLVRTESKLPFEHRTRMRVFLVMGPRAECAGESTRMTKLARNALRFALAAAAGTVCLFINDNTSLAQRSSLISQADAKSVAPHHYGSGAGGYYGASGGAYYGGYANRGSVTGKRTLIPRH